MHMPRDNGKPDAIFMTILIVVCVIILIKTRPKD